MCVCAYTRARPNYEFGGGAIVVVVVDSVVIIVLRLLLLSVRFNVKLYIISRKLISDKTAVAMISKFQLVKRLFSLFVYRLE